MPKLKILHTTTRLVRGGGVENNIFHTIDHLKEEYDFILSSGADMQENPFAGDDEYRRRVGSYRIFFDLHRNQRIIFVSRVERRTSTTY